MAFIDKIKEVNLPVNIYRFPNNAYPAFKITTIYNDSINLYKAILEVVNSVTTSSNGTDLNSIATPSNVTITSSTGTDAIIPSASLSNAGVMTSGDKLILNNLLSTMGTPGSNLGTFTGTIISDFTTVKNALQELETAVSSVAVTNTNLSTSYTTDDVTVISSTGTDATINQASFSSAGVISASAYGVLVSVPQLHSLTGLPLGSSDLGTFTGSTISNNVSIKAALQELETALEASSSGGGIYGGSGTIFPNAVASVDTSFTISTTNGPVLIGEASGNRVYVTNTGTFIEHDPSNNRLKVDNFGVELRGGTSGYISVSTSGGIDLIATAPATISVSTGEGIKYAADYSAGFTARSLVDKEYVDGLTGTTTNITITQSNTTVAVNSSSGTSGTIIGATSSTAGVMTSGDKRKLDDLVTLSGVAAEAEDLGTFTGTTIPDNSDIKEALQALETAVENADNSAGSYQLVTSSFTLGAHISNYVKTAASNITITLNASMEEGEMYYVYVRTSGGKTVTFTPAAGFVVWPSLGLSSSEITTSPTVFGLDDTNITFMLQRRGGQVFLSRTTFPPV